MRYSGKVGYSIETEVSEGNWENITKEVLVTGSVIDEKYNNFKTSEYQTSNDSLTLQNRFSILFTKELLDNFPNIKYIIYNGIKWKVENVKLVHPRMILTVGGVWNG